MGKPRMIILVRHAQSEGNKNRDIHQFIPDHRVKLTSDGWNQAEEAGRRLRSMLKPDDTIQFFTSPYRRTRETTEGILRTLTADDPAPSPFPRHKIKVFEEPRLREQDFGNFQPCSAEMERMWQERADYGHFFYRIPHGESAADAYDRISGFNESMWRQFGEPDFPSVCVLVTHGLMTRVFLMKWYHWSVEYFEDLRNVNHCEFIIMKQNPANGKYILQNELRTWSDLKKRAAATGNGTSAVTATPSKASIPSSAVTSSPTIPVRRWGGCVNGCNHDKMNYPRRITRKNTADYFGAQLPAPAMSTTKLKEEEEEKEDHPIPAGDATHPPTSTEPSPTTKLSRKPSSASKTAISMLPMTPASPNDASNSDTQDSGEEDTSASIPPLMQHPPARNPSLLRRLNHSSASGSRTAALQGEGFSDDSDYFPGMQHLHISPSKSTNTSSSATKPRLRASSKQRQQSRDRKTRKMSQKEWVAESGMGLGARADTLGDGDEVMRSASPEGIREEVEEEQTPILKEAARREMEAKMERGGEGREDGDDGLDGLVRENVVLKAEVERLKEEDRKGFSEVY